MTLTSLQVDRSLRLRTPLEFELRRIVMNTAVLIVAAMVLGFAVGRIRSLNGFSKKSLQ